MDVVFELLAKSLSSLDDDEIRKVLLAAGKGATVLAGKPTEESLLACERRSS